MGMKLSPELQAKVLALAGQSEPPPPSIEETIDEKPFMQAVIMLAEKHCWKVYHTYDSRKSQAGFPDLVLVRGRSVIFAETKRQKEHPTAAQLAWGEVLAGVGGNVEYYLWRPKDWPDIVKRITAPEPAACAPAESPHRSAGS